MAETLSLNQFAPNVPLAGMYVYLANLPQFLILNCKKNTIISIQESLM